MIEINEKQEHEPFPVIDFKFRNTEAVAAFLWQFTIRVLEAEIDTTPLLRFRLSTNNGSLRVAVRNDGWGPAKNVSLLLSEPNVDKLFEEADRRATLTDIPSGGRVDALTVHSKRMNRKKFSAWGGKSVEVLLSTFHLHWSCKSADNTSISRTASYSSDNPTLYLNWKGFYSMLVLSEELSDTTYCCVIDPSQGQRSREYNISRKIPAGDVERFHIMIGATMSCKLRLQFVFRVNEDTTVESETFALEILCPRDMRHSYEDGDSISYDDDEFIPLGIDLDGRGLRHSSTYPFINPKRHRRRRSDF